MCAVCDRGFRQIALRVGSAGRETPHHSAVHKIECGPLVFNTSEKNPLSHLNDVSRCTRSSVLPTNGACLLIKRINMTYRIWRATLVCANQNYVIYEQRIAVEAL